MIDDLEDKKKNISPSKTKPRCPAGATCRGKNITEEICNRFVGSFTIDLLHCKRQHLVPSLMPRNPQGDEVIIAPRQLGMRLPTNIHFYGNPVLTFMLTSNLSVLVCVGKCLLSQ